MANLEERIEALETRLAYQEAAQQTLDDVVARQQQEIAALREQCARLAQQLETLRSASSRGRDEPPPHY